MAATWTYNRSAGPVRNTGEPRAAPLYEMRTLLACVMALCTVTGQSSPPADPSVRATFRTQTQVVQVPVVVMDRKGRPLHGLDPHQFQVLDDGRPQQILVDTFETGVAPIALIIAVQTSGISAAVLAKVHEIGSMIQPIVTGERGRVALLGFNEEIRWHQDWTRNPDEIASSLWKLRPGEPTKARLLDAVLEAAKKLEGQEGRRRVLLLISESRDRGSESELDAVLAALQSAGVLVYAATYSAFKTAFTTRPGDADRPDKVPGPPNPATSPQSPRLAERSVPNADNRMDILGGLRELMRLGKERATELLTGQTGGRELPFARQKGLEQAITALGEELHSHYLISFRPDCPRDGYHAIQVIAPGDIRARKGYWSRGRSAE
jgi:VWFA-related protein